MKRPSTEVKLSQFLMKRLHINVICKGFNNENNKSGGVLETQCQGLSKKMLKIASHILTNIYKI